jgi:hypothetical protein
MQGIPAPGRRCANGDTPFFGVERVGRETFPVRVGRGADLAIMVDVATVEIEGDRVVAHFPGYQALMALARQVAVPVADVRTVEVVPDGWDVKLGWRVGGTSIPRRLAFGRFRRKGVRTFAGVYCGQPALVIETAGGDWDRIAIAVDEPERVAAAVREAAGLGTGD